MASTLRLHGLSIASDLRLDAAPAEVGPVDLEIRSAEPRTVAGPPPDVFTLAEHRLADGQGYVLVRSADGTVTLHVTGVCEVAWSGAGPMTVTAAPDAATELVGLLVSGAALAARLVLDGATVLHAAAVEVAGEAIVVAGPSGAGKSTVAARLCLDGAPLVADDLVRLDLEDRVACHRGSTSVRLRSGAAALANGTPGIATRRTIDDRLAVAYPATSAERLPVRAVVVPRRRPGAPELRRLRGPEAVAALSAASRVQGWADAGVLARWLHDVATIARAVPVVELASDWEHVLAPGLRDRLLAGIAECVRP